MSDKLRQNDREWTKQMAKTLLLLREMSGMNIRDYAKRLDISHATLSRIENEQPCDVDTLIKIHIATGVTLHTLLGIKK